LDPKELLKVLINCCNHSNHGLLSDSRLVLRQLLQLLI